MKKYFKTLTLLLAGALILFASCTKTDGSKPGNGNPPPDEQQPGDGNGETPGGNTVTGFVRDTHGNPIAGATVSAENNVFNNWVEGTTDANGKYVLTGVIEGGWNIYAWSDVNYEGKTYHMRMGMEKPEDYNPFAGMAGQPVTKNFVWQLQGEIPDRSHDDLNSFGFWGGTLVFKTLDINFNDLGEGTVVTVTCTPMPGATLMDGSPAQKVVRTFTSHITRPATWMYAIQDIPQSVYSVSATCVMNGQTKRLGLGWDIDEATHNSIDNFSFSPVSGGDGSYESGLETMNDNPLYLMVQD